METTRDKFFHDAEYRRELLYSSIQNLLTENSMSQAQLVKVLQKEFGFTKMTPSQFSKMFSPHSSQKQAPDLAVVFAIAEYFDVPVNVLFEGGSKKSVPYDMAKHFTNRQFCQLLYWLEQAGIIVLNRCEDSDGNIVEKTGTYVRITLSDKADGAVMSFLLMYIAAKTTIPSDNPEGAAMLEEFAKMLINYCNDKPVFSEYYP